MEIWFHIVGVLAFEPAEAEFAAFVQKYSYRFPAGSRALERFHQRMAELGKKTLNMSCEILSSKRELAASWYFRLDAVKTVKLGLRDRDRTLALAENRGCRCFRKVVLSRHALRAEGISFTREEDNILGRALLLGSRVAEIVKAEKFTGARVVPVFRPDRARLENIAQWVPRAIAPAMERNLATPVSPESMLDDDRSLLGLATYDSGALDQLGDVAEPVESWVSGFIVSQRVRACLVKNKIRGTYLEPVLEHGSAEHRELINAFAHAVQHFRANPLNNPWLVEPDPSLAGVGLRDALAHAELSMLLRGKR